MQETLPQEVLESIGVISSQMRLRFGADTEPRLGFVALATLRHLARHGPRTVSELAEADLVTTQAISVRIRPLVEGGLVTRRRDPHDARRTVLAVTELGTATLADASARALGALAAAISNLTPDERDALEAATPVLRRIGGLLAQESR